MLREWSWTYDSTNGWSCRGETARRLPSPPACKDLRAWREKMAGGEGSGVRGFSTAGGLMPGRHSHWETVEIHQGRHTVSDRAFATLTANPQYRKAPLTPAPLPPPLFALVLSLAGTAEGEGNAHGLRLWLGKRICTQRAEAKEASSCHETGASNCRRNRWLKLATTNGLFVSPGPA
jgi:hypothetical protein